MPSRSGAASRSGVIPRIAEQLGVGVESLRAWLKQADIDAGKKPGTSNVDAARIAELEREVRDLRRANEMAVSTGGRNELGEPL
jgi:transposase